MEINENKPGTPDMRRPNETVAVLPKAGKVTLLTRRLFNILLYCSQRDGAQDVYRRPLGEIMDLMQYGSRNSELLKEHLRAMQSVQIEWNDSHDQEKRWGVSGMIAQAEIIERTGVGTFVEWSLPPKIRERLLDPSFYTPLSLQIHSSLRSGASVALYEICSRYATNPSRVTMRAPWEWWLPRITGNRDDENKEFKYFKRDVIKRALVEINAVANFTVELIEHKNGKRVTEIQFAVHPKPQAELFTIGVPDYNGELLERVIRLGVGQKEARAVCAANPADFVLHTVLLTESRAANAALTPLNSKVAYFRSGLTKRFVDTQTVAKAPQKPAPAKPTPAQQKARLTAMYHAQQSKEAFGYWKEQEVEQQKELLDEFLTTEPPQLIRDEIKKRGLAAMPAKTAFTTWLAKKMWGELTADELLEFSMKVK